MQHAQNKVNRMSSDVEEDVLEEDGGQGEITNVCAEAAL